MIGQMSQEHPKILALETSGTLGSAALACGSQLLCEHNFTAKFQHASQLLPTMADLFRAQDWRPEELEHIYISAGPGSFTGLRIAVTIAKTLAYANFVRVVAVPSTDVAAMNVFDVDDLNSNDSCRVATVVDAKRRQIYTAVYEIKLSKKASGAHACGSPGELSPPGGVSELPYGLVEDGRFVPGLHPVVAASMMPPGELLEITDKPLYLLGEGLGIYRQALTAPGVIHLPQASWPGRASNVHRCGWLRAQANLFVDPDRLGPFYLRRPEAVERWEKRQQLLN